MSSYSNLSDMTFLRVLKLLIPHLSFGVLLLMFYLKRLNAKSIEQLSN